MILMMTLTVTPTTSIAIYNHSFYIVALNFIA